MDIERIIIQNYIIFEFEVPIAVIVSNALSGGLFCQYLCKTIGVEKNLNEISNH